MDIFSMDGWVGDVFLFGMEKHGKRGVFWVRSTVYNMSFGVSGGTLLSIIYQGRGAA